MTTDRQPIYVGEEACQKCGGVGEAFDGNGWLIVCRYCCGTGHRDPAAEMARLRAELAETQASCDGLRLALAASEANRLRGNQWLLDERDAAIKELAYWRNMRADWDILEVEKALDDGESAHRLWQMAEAERDAARADAEKAWALAELAVGIMEEHNAEVWLARYEQAKREKEEAG